MYVKSRDMLIFSYICPLNLNGNLQTLEVTINPQTHHTTKREDFSTIRVLRNQESYVCLKLAVLDRKHVSFFYNLRKERPFCVIMLIISHPKTRFSYICCCNPQVVGEWRLKCEDLGTELELSHRECRNQSSELFRLRAAWDEAVEQLDSVR